MSAEGLSGADLRLSQVHVADRLSIPALTTYSTSSDVPHAARFPMRNDCCPQMDEEPPKGWTRWNQRKKSDYISKIGLQRARAAAKPESGSLPLISAAISPPCCSDDYDNHRGVIRACC